MRTPVMRKSARGFKYTSLPLSSSSWLNSPSRRGSSATWASTMEDRSEATTRSSAPLSEMSFRLFSQRISAVMVKEKFRFFFRFRRRMICTMVPVSASSSPFDQSERTMTWEASFTISSRVSSASVPR